MLNVDPQRDALWRQLFESRQHVATDGVHEKDRLHPSVETPGQFWFPSHVVLPRPSKVSLQIEAITLVLHLIIEPIYLSCDVEYEVGEAQ